MSQETPAGGTKSMRVALKVFPEKLSDSKQELLRRELRAFRRIEHQHILPFLGTAMHGPQTVIVLPYMANGNLLEYLRRTPTSGRCDDPTDRLIQQVASAVCYLHYTAGITHGDLKCSNVLVSNTHDALLTDFGLATTIDKEGTTSDIIRSQMTLRFCAPELFIGLDNVSCLGGRSKTQATDIYAFGMLMLEAYTQKAPWHGLRDYQVSYQLAKQKIPERPRDCRSLNDFLWFVCRQCWMVNPSQRPPTHRITGLNNIPVDVLKLMFEMEWAEWGFPSDFKTATSSGSLRAISRAKLIQSLRTAHKRSRNPGISAWTRDDFPSLEEAYKHIDMQTVTTRRSRRPPAMPTAAQALPEMNTPPPTRSNIRKAHRAFRPDLYSVVASSGPSPPLRTPSGYEIIRFDDYTRSMPADYSSVKWDYDAGAETVL
ncbi:kinase-like protein [Exidia glandulosa HHB12029]|uniref:Kinase-like protein n=1 Tax=Exidia glandulosa HHB12029 TaxID=1314781 RepID=A0A165MLF8_EXIGL|nr:kinase-like protein [Exidia glandulosa HHB12029]